MTPREKEKAVVRWRRVPVPPTRKMLIGMADATFLKDGSLLEMERRFNGMLDALPKRARLAKKGRK
jgi:hypothetical protein